MPQTAEAVRLKIDPLPPIDTIFPGAWHFTEAASDRSELRTLEASDANHSRWTQEYLATVADTPRWLRLVWRRATFFAALQVSQKQKK